MVGNRAIEAVQALRRRAQDQRWRLISQGISVTRHEYFGAVMLSEQWAVARMAMADDRSPIGQILGERRLRAIEAFLHDNLPDALEVTEAITASEGVAADAVQPESHTTALARANGDADEAGGEAEPWPVSGERDRRPDNRAGRPS